MANLIIVQAIIVTTIGCLLYRRVFQKKRKNLPPGPRPLPLVGNVRDLPPKGTPEHEHWLKHKHAYGPISSVTVLGQTIVLLHDRKAVQEILEKMSLKSSGRPSLDLANYCGFGEFINLLQLGETLKQQRKFIHQALGSKSLVAKFADVQELEARRLLLRLLDKPGKTVHHFETQAAAIILKIVYGYTIEPNGKDPLVELIIQMLVHFSSVSLPFTWLVDFIPLLYYLPEGLPGTGFKTAARQFEKELQAVLDVPYEFARRQMATGNPTESYVSKLLRGSTGGDNTDEPGPDVLHNIKWSAAALYVGGAETTFTNMTIFTLAMVMFPRVQLKAQEEIDRVTGGNRLPTIHDREQMPYIEAMATEVLRWIPVAPLGLPHMASDDITYENYDLPKGTLIFTSVWWLMHDPEVYPDPDAFVPERFLAPRNEPDPRSMVFGFGRRLCPGRYLGDTTMFLTIAHLLSVFDIKPALDEQGREIEVKADVEPGIVAKPRDFPHRIVPRSERHAEMIRNVVHEQPWEESDASLLGQMPPLDG